MNKALRLVALFTGVAVLIISIYWSQDGFNFGIAGDSGYNTMAYVFGYTLAISVTVIQFIFSTNFRELNPSLILFGVLAYLYSVYTNQEGITHFQGANTNPLAAWILGFCIDGIPEPLIAWSLRESLSGDFVGNIFHIVGKVFSSVLDGKTEQKPKIDTQPAMRVPPFRQDQPTIHTSKKGHGRHFLEEQRKESSNRFFGE